MAHLFRTLAPGDSIAATEAHPAPRDTQYVWDNTSVIVLQEAVLQHMNQILWLTNTDLEKSSKT